MNFQLAPDPADARRWRDRLAEAGLTEGTLAPDEAEVALLCCTQAPYLAMLALRDPGRLRAAAADPYLRREKPRARQAEELAAALAGTADAADLSRRLRAYRAREYIRLGARECGLGNAEEVGRELAGLADVTMGAAIAFHDAELARTIGEPLGEDGARAELVVFGMGKLGGEELNFSSDIDVIYVYTTDAGAAGKLSLHEYFDKLARRVTHAIGEVTEDDAVFRVDLRLRPEGTRGPLVNSLPSVERYYESWGRPWERQAWLKARPSAGSMALGAETLAVLEPFIHPRTVGPSVIADVAELNRRIKAELLPGTLETGFDVKIGVGGIREIEFFVQALQLVHAGKQPGLRERSTRRALDRLLFAGLIAERERRALGDAYELLRQVEHRLQLVSGRQTHRLPTEPAALGVLARRLGMADVGELRARLEMATRQVAEIFATLGDERPYRPEVAAVLDPRVPPARLDEALGALGFRDREDAAFQLDLLRRRPTSPLGGAASAAAARLAPALIEELSASPDPDLALRMTVDLAARGGGGGLWQLLEENRPLLRLVASLFGTSAFLSKSFVQHPELLDMLLLVGRGGPRRSRADLAAAVVTGADEEDVWNSLRRVKNEELLRIGLADIAGDLPLEAVFEQLSDLADICVQRTFELVRAAAARRAPVPPMAVLGLGKLGGRELGYASDLDLVFVYDGGVDEHEAATRVAQRLVGALGAVLEEGRLYEVDTRLRPSGQQGTLVSSVSAWREYHRSAAQLWERQALLRLRAVAGDPELGRAIEAEAASFAYAEDLSPAVVAGSIASMRARIEKEIGREERGTNDLKAGRGGLIDVEFAAQFLQLAPGGRHPGLRARATLAALAGARQAGLLDEASHATLLGGYRFLRLVENRLRIVHDRPIHEYPRDPAELDKLARRAGFPSAGALDRAYLAWTRDVRAVYERLLGVTSVTAR
jgi:[glutamine synthetase] adenylyltransferase / [glutamine synthetase]-adenylyl-L-tyrosine phosphorylase